MYQGPINTTTYQQLLRVSDTRDPQYIYLGAVKASWRYQGPRPASLPSSCSASWAHKSVLYVPAPFRQERVD
jgi:hypothetical protein